MIWNFGIYTPWVIWRLGLQGNYGKIREISRSLKIYFLLVPWRFNYELHVFSDFKQYGISLRSECTLWYRLSNINILKFVFCFEYLWLNVFVFFCFHSWRPEEGRRRIRARTTRAIRVDRGLSETNLKLHQTYKNIFLIKQQGK